MKRVKLDRSEARRLQSDPGSVAEELAARAYGFSTFKSSNFDAARDSGAVLEVKSTTRRIGDEYPARGRFRLFKRQHEKLVRRDRDGTAYYAFVLISTNTNPPGADMLRKKPADVGRRIGARGGWNQSGHASGPQAKLPWSLFF
jgi:hypothetical protein